MGKNSGGKEGLKERTGGETAGIKRFDRTVREKGSGESAIEGWRTGGTWGKED